MAKDVLEVVPLEEVPKLLKIFEKDWPKFYPLKQYVKIFSENKKSKVDLPQQNLFRYGGFEDGVYLIETHFSIEGKLNMISYFLFTTSEDLSDLKHALMMTSRIPWKSKGFIFEITFARLVPTLREVAKAKGLELIEKLNYMVWLPEPVDCGTVPQDMYIAGLNESHVPEINSNWPHRFPGSEKFLEQQIKSYFGLGLFRKTDKKLACSALTFQSGGVFVLYTDPEFRGKGYADLIVRRMSDELRKKGRTPFATILLENIPSQKLFTKIGFKVFTKVYFMLNLPENS